MISDLHGDLAALDRVLGAIEHRHPDEIWCLGDIVGLGATDPAQVVDVVRTTCAVALAGNHDRWVTGALSLDMLPLPRQRAELQWQRTQLSDQQLEWLAGLPAHAGRNAASLWHASAEDPLTGWISAPADAASHLARQQTPIGLVGHTHRPLIARLHEGHLQCNEHPGREDLMRTDRAVLNPGAVTATCRWLELDLGAHRATWHQQ